MPAAVFDVLLGGLEALEAHHQTVVAHGTAFGSAMRDSRQAETQRMIRRLHRAAFPRMYRRREQSAGPPEA